jgi:hypothetical protein
MKNFEAEKELLNLFINWWKEITLKQKLKVVGTVIFAIALVWGGIYFVSLAGYISGT